MSYPTRKMSLVLLGAALALGLTLRGAAATPARAQAPADVPAAERAALVALYNATDGAHWSFNGNWLVGDPCANSWDGVWCNDGRVTGLYRGSRNLTGTIPPELGNLSVLETLDLAHNHLTGTIPPELGNLSALSRLDLTDNQLNGSIPSEFANLGGLRELWLANNQLGGSIPSALGDLSALEHMWLADNRLSGSIPSQLGDLSALQHLHLEDNHLSGSIPPELGHLTSLQDLYLNGNQLSGSIPSELGHLSILRYLYLHGNQLRGSIPSELGNLSPLYVLDLGYNALEDTNPSVRAFLEAKDPGWASTQTVPPTEVNVTRVTALSVALAWRPIAYTADAGYYQIGAASTAGGPYTVAYTGRDKAATDGTATDLEPGQVYHLAVRTYTPAHWQQQNALTSPWSSEVTATTRTAEPVAGLAAANDSPTALGQSTTLTATVTEGTNVTYTWALGDGVLAQGAVVTHTYTALGRYTALVTATNALSAPTVVTATTTVEIVVMTEREALVALYNATDGAHWYARANWLVGDPCANAWAGVTCNAGRVTELNLDDNGLTGTVPSELGALSALQRLDLSDNELSGSIPPELGNLAALKILRLYTNRLSGSIPPALGNLSALEELYLGGNQLSGSIPPELGNLGALYGLGLQTNQLTGKIPLALGHLSALTFLSLDNNRLGGSIPPELGNLTRLHVLGLASNALVGEVPASLTQLVAVGTEWYGRVDLGYNALEASDPSVRAFLDAKDPDWANTQTTPPIRVRVTDVTTDSVTLAWRPITYTADGGYYQIGAASTADGFYTVVYTAPDKLVSAGTVSHIEPAHVDHLAVRTVTLAHGAQQNAVTSAWSRAVTPTIGPPDAVEGLHAANDSPTVLGHSTTLTATVREGTLVTYTWVLGDGALADGAVVTHTYATLGRYTALVTATNALNALTGTTMVDIVALSERDALVALYNATDGAHWTSNRNWLVGDPCTNAWYGVACDGRRVASLGLGSNNLSGSIPPELGNLGALQWLSLGGNPLSGSIPPELGNLSALQWLSLGSSHLSGSIPPELGNLDRLGALRLEFNQLSGSIPPELGNLSALQQLYLLCNRLSGSIPPELGNLTGLRELYLEANAVEGEVPVSIASLLNLDPGGIGLRWNKLQASDPTVRAFLDARDWGWANTQTVPPTDVRVTGVTTDSVTLAWTPIGFAAADQIGYAFSPGGPYTPGYITVDRYGSAGTVANLPFGQTCYLAVRSYMPAHDAQQNALWSAWSAEVTALTTGSKVCLPLVQR